MSQICPLTFLRKEKALDCKKELCAWWNDQRWDDQGKMISVDGQSRCAVLDMSHISARLTEFINRLDAGFGKMPL